jgi:general secretion pathway protein G
MRKHRRRIGVPHSPFTIPRSHGFTLIEIMLVVIIIGVLAAMVVPRLVGRTEQAKIARARSDIAAIGLALDLYELDIGRYPESLDELVAKDAPSSVGQGTRWNGPYLKKGLPKDPWGRPYEYQRESQHHQDYDLSSLGTDGKPGTDDVTNWE